VKASSIKFSLSTLTLLGLASIASAPALADSAQISANPDSQPTSEIQTNALKGKDLPFFARFLEGQKREVTPHKVALTEDRTIERKRSNLPEMTTKKYPSDTEDSSGGGIVTTQKYPSDAEDSSGGGIVTTQKYPSDAEDSSGGGVVMTKKYPSDAEDNSGGNVHPRHRR
jgi:hypothetical protein